MNTMLGLQGGWAVGSGALLGVSIFDLIKFMNEKAQMAEDETGSIKAWHTHENQGTRPTVTAESWITYPQQLQQINTVGMTSVGEISPLSFIVGVAAIPSGSQLFIPQTGH